MSVIKSHGSGDVSSGFYNGTTTRSLRFNGRHGVEDPWLQRTGAIASGNGKKWIFAFWIKPCAFGNDTAIMTAGPSSTNYSAITFAANGDLNATDALHIVAVASNSNEYALQTKRLFRDPTNWQHICIAFDSTQTTERNRMAIFINGKLYNDTNTASNHFEVYTTYPSVDTVPTYFNSNLVHRIGVYHTGADSGNLEGYLADMYFLDNQSIFTSTSGAANTTFINSDKDTLVTFCEQNGGIAIPKPYTGATSTYGNNGFHLDFKHTGVNYTSEGTSATTNIGDDKSGNGHNWEINGNNITTTDVVLDNPENNFATLNPLYRDRANVSGPATLDEGNLKATGTGPAGQWNNIFSTIPVSSGKWYVEFYGGGHVGILASNAMPTNYFSHLSDGYSYYYNGQKVNGGTFTNYGSGFFYPNNNIVGLALDLDNGTLHFYNDNVLQTGSAAFTGLSGKEYVIGCCIQGTNSTISVNFGQDSTFAGAYTNSQAYQNNINNYANASDGNGIGKFFFTPPSGYLALCSANLTTNVISPTQSSQADDHFKSIIWTGGGTDANAKTVGFRPDWLWAKDRDNANHHILLDSSRGVNKYLQSALTSDETTDSNVLQSFDPTGFTTVGQGINFNSVKYVGWNWKAGGATPTQTYKVKVVGDSTNYGHGDGSNKYQFLKSDGSTGFGTNGVTIDLQEGGTYVFDWSDSSAQGHPIRFSTTPNGTHGSGTEYTTGVVKDDSAYKTTITVDSSAPTLNYYCQYHSGMGGQVNTNSLHGSTNFDGSGLSIVQANTLAGFSIAKYSGTGTGNDVGDQTIGHGLQVNGVATTPDMMIIKARTDASTSWAVWHKDMDRVSGVNNNTDFLLLNSNAGNAQNSDKIWDAGLPNTTTFSIGYDFNVNKNGEDYISYHFASLEGYSKIGSYIGNGNASDGTMVMTGFRPSFVMIKDVTASAEWVVVDNARDTFNAVNSILAWNSAEDEPYWGDTNRVIDFVSSGFKIVSTASAGTSALNHAGDVYIYMAFAEQPLKFSNGR